MYREPSYPAKRKHVKFCSAWKGIVQVFGQKHMLYKKCTSTHESIIMMFNMKESDFVEL